ncbi:MAG: glycosyltransferase family 39 protein [Prevotella sp.]|nr:glycosyltransferase family 39 protein [Prevotella sp.]
MNLFLKSVLSLLLLFLLTALIITLLLPFNNTVLHFFVNRFDYFENIEDAYSIFANRSYLFFQLILIFSIIIVVVAFIKVDILSKWLSSFLYYTKRAVINIFNDLKSKNIILLLVIPVISSIFFAFTIPISLDEALTYIYLTNEPLYWSYSSYYEPNNHVLHSLITHLTKRIPFFNTLFCIRVSAILSTFLTWVILYSFVKKYFSEKVSLFVVAISSMMFMSVYYSYMSRGYSLTTLFFVICLYAAFNIMKNDSKNKDWAFFSIAGVLGMYTIPSFLYPFFTLNFLILIYNYKKIKQQVLFNLLTGIATFSLYIPIMIRHGIGALTANGWVVPIDRKEVLLKLPTFFSQTIQEIVGIPAIISGIIILSAFIYTCWNKDKPKLILWAVFGLSPVCLLLLHSVIPFPRTFAYYTIIIAFLVGISYGSLINKIPKTWLTIGLFIIQIACFINFYRHIGEYESFNTHYHDINKRIIEKDKTYYVVSGFGCYNHRFEMLVNDCDLKNVVYKDIYWTKEDVSADTISGYDYVIIDAVRDKTVRRKPIYSNKEQNLYKKK